MTSELLSAIQTICLIVAGLTSVTVTLFVIWHCLRRPPARSMPFFGGQTLPGEDREIDGPRLCAGRPDPAGTPTRAEPAGSTAQFAVCHPDIGTRPSCDRPDAYAGRAVLILPLDTVAGPVYVAGLTGFDPVASVATSPDVAASHPNCRVEGKKASRRVWLLRQALSKFTAKRYDIVAAHEHAAAVGL